MSQNNKNEENERIRLDMLNTFNKLSNNSTVNVGQEMFSTLLKTYSQNDLKINYIIGILQDQINQTKKAEKKEFLKLLSLAAIKPLSKHTSRFLTILQSCIADENSMLFTFIANIYGEIVDKVITANNTNSSILNNNSNLKISNSLSEKEKDNENKNNNLNSLYELFQGFCIYNMKQDSKANQICGSLCLTSLIETCPNVLQPQYLKYLWENIVLFIDLPNYQAKSELLNSLISLIFAAENLFKPFATVTLYKILDYLTDNDWFKRKLALNVVYTLVIYCQEEIVSLKGHIIEFLKVLKSDKVKEVREVCLQTLKLFNDAKLCEDEKSLDNIDCSKSNLNVIDTPKIDNNNFATNASNNKKSKKELVPIPNKKNLRDNLSPKNNATTNNSLQNNEKSFTYEKGEKSINNSKPRLQKNPYFKFSNNNSNYNNINDNSDLNLDEDALLTGLNNNKNSNNTNVIKVSKVSSASNLGNKGLKIPSNNNNNSNLNNSNIMNISSNTDGIKSTRNKSMKIGFNNINKSRDKSFQIDNEEEKVERIKNIRKRRATKNRNLDNKGKSEEREPRKPKRSADFSIFKTQMNPNFIKNAPKKEDGGILIAFKERLETDNDKVFINIKSEIQETEEMNYKSQEDIKIYVKPQPRKNSQKENVINNSKEESQGHFKNEENIDNPITTYYSKSKLKNKYVSEDPQHKANIAKSNKLSKSIDHSSDKEYSFHEEKVYHMGNQNLGKDGEDILGDFINNYQEKDKFNVKKTNFSTEQQVQKNNFNFDYSTSSARIHTGKYEKLAAYEVARNSSTASLKNSLNESHTNNMQKSSQNKKAVETNSIFNSNSQNEINNNNANLITNNSQEANESSFNKVLAKSNKQFEDDSAQLVVADEMNSHSKINNISKNNNTSFSKGSTKNVYNSTNNNNPHYNQNSILNNVNNLKTNNLQENLLNNTSHNNNYVVFNTAEKNFLSNEEMTFSANNNMNTHNNPNNLSNSNIHNLNNNYIADILSQMKMISEKQNFILEKIKNIEENTGGQFYQMNSRIEKLENFIFQMMANKLSVAPNINFVPNVNMNNMQNMNNHSPNVLNGEYVDYNNYNLSFGAKPYNQGNNLPSHGNASNRHSNGSVNTYQTNSTHEFNNNKEANISYEKNSNNNLSNFNNNQNSSNNAVKSQPLPKKNGGNTLADIFFELKKNNPTEAFKIALRSEEINLIKLIEKINVNLLREVEENTIYESIQKLLIILNRGEKILNITNFIKNIFVTINYNVKGFIVQSVKDSLHYLLSNKQHFRLGEEEMIDINLILTNINNRKF